MTWTKPRTVADIDRALTELWQKYRADRGFWAACDTLLDERLTLAAQQG